MICDLTSLEWANYYIAHHKALLLDIRTMDEFCKGHICGANLIPTPFPKRGFTNKKLLEMRDRLNKRVSNLSRDHPILVYCKKGIRAGVAKNILRSMGFNRVYNLGGVEEGPLSLLFSGLTEDAILRICHCAY